MYPRLPGNTITTGHTYFDNSETEVEPTYLGRLPWDIGKPIPAALFKIMRRPERGPVSAISKINEERIADKAIVASPRLALGAKNIASLPLQAKREAPDRDSAIACGIFAPTPC